jgi:hypothetical protein
VEPEQGIWVLKIGVYFATKPSGGDIQHPIKCQIRPLINGYPSSSAVLQQAESILTPADVTTSTDGTAITYFEFDEPIYLEGDKDYAFLLITNTTLYNVYVSQIEDFIIGSTSKRVTKQPSLGSLFASQNAKTWSADQTKDICFEIVIARFDTSSYGQVFLKNADVPFRLLEENPFRTVTGDSDVIVYSPNHGFDVGDVIQIKGVDSTDSADIGNLTVGGLPGTQLTGTHTITAVDGNSFTFKADSAADSDDIGGGNKVLATTNIPFTKAWPSIDVFLPGTSTFAASARTTTGKSLAGSETSMAKPTTYSEIYVNKTNTFTNPKLLANRATEVAELTDPAAGDKSFDIKIDLIPTSTLASPAIDLNRVSLTTINNVIDKQDSASTSGFNVPIVFSPETAAFGGTSLAKHITKIVELAETATGIKVIVGANRPSVAGFDLYYRVGTSDTLLEGLPWILKTEDTNNAPDDDANLYQDYEYLIGGLGGQIAPFTKFQLKIVMYTTNTAKVPTFKNLRVIALAD